MSVRANHRRHFPVQVSGQHLFVAGRFGVNIDNDVLRLITDLGKGTVDRVKGTVDGAHVDTP